MARFDLGETWNPQLGDGASGRVRLREGAKWQGATREKSGSVRQERKVFRVQLREGERW